MKTFFLPSMLFCVVLLSPLSRPPAYAKLVSSAMAEQRAKNIIDDIFRRTRLNDDERFWGDRYKDEITRFTKALGVQFYVIFSDLNLSKAMARCAVNAKNESDYQRWLRQMDEFDRAVKELDRKDQAKYFFAKGLLIMQSVPRNALLPPDFFKAAENGYSSSFLAEYITPESSGNLQKNAASGYNLPEILQKFAESYRRGNEMMEAYKFYLLTLKYGTIKGELFVRMVECAHADGNDSLALASAMLFLESVSLYQSGSTGTTPGIVNNLPITAGMAAEDIGRVCLSAYQQSPAPEEAVIPASADERTFSGFDGRYLQPMIQNLGSCSDFFKSAVCFKYWSDSVVVKRILPRINGPAGNQYIDKIISRLHDDQRMNSDTALAVWESRRWKEAGRLADFTAQYPERSRLAGLGP